MGKVIPTGRISNASVLKNGRAGRLLEEEGFGSQCLPSGRIPRIINRLPIMAGDLLVAKLEELFSGRDHVRLTEEMTGDCCGVNQREQNTYTAGDRTQWSDQRCDQCANECNEQRTDRFLD